MAFFRRITAQSHPASFGGIRRGKGGKTNSHCSKKGPSEYDPRGKGQCCREAALVNARKTKRGNWRGRAMSMGKAIGWGGTEKERRKHRNLLHFGGARRGYKSSSFDQSDPSKEERNAANR